MIKSLLFHGVLNIESRSTYPRCLLLFDNDNAHDIVSVNIISAHVFVTGDNYEQREPLE